MSGVIMCVCFCAEVQKFVCVITTAWPKTPMPIIVSQVWSDEPVPRATVACQCGFVGTNTQSYTVPKTKSTQPYHIAYCAHTKCRRQVHLQLRRAQGD